MSHFTPYGNVVYERSTGGLNGLSLVEGLEYQVNEKIAVEMAAQQLDLYGGSLDYQFILGMTVNFGSAQEVVRKSLPIIEPPRSPRKELKLRSRGV